MTVNKSDQYLRLIAAFQTLTLQQQQMNNEFLWLRGKVEELRAHVK